MIYSKSFEAKEQKLLDVKIFKFFLGLIKYKFQYWNEKHVFNLGFDIPEFDFFYICWNTFFIFVFVRNCTIRNSEVSNNRINFKTNYKRINFEDSYYFCLIFLLGENWGKISDLIYRWSESILTSDINRSDLVLQIRSFVRI